MRSYQVRCQNWLSTVSCKEIYGTSSASFEMSINQVRKILCANFKEHLYRKTRNLVTRTRLGGYTWDIEHTWRMSVQIYADVISSSQNEQEDFEGRLDVELGTRPTQEDIDRRGTPNRMHHTPVGQWHHARVYTTILIARCLRSIYASKCEYEWINEL